MKISVNLEVSQRTNHTTIDLDDLNLSQAEWEHMTESEKEEAVKEWISEMNDQPYWMLDSFEEQY